MGKVGGTSWLAAVKRAFRSPTKDNEKKSCRRREDREPEDEEKVLFFFKFDVILSTFWPLTTLLFLGLYRREEKEDGYSGNLHQLRKQQLYNILQKEA